MTHESDHHIDNNTMQAALDSRRPITGVILKRGPAYDDPESQPLQWEHARNMLRLLSVGTMTHVSALIDGTDVLGFALAEGTKDDVAAEMSSDPAVAGGRLTFELVTAISFDIERDRHLLAQP